MRLFAILGQAASRIFKKERRKAVRNLSIAFPESSPLLQGAMVRSMFRTLGRNIYEFLNLEGTSVNYVGSLVQGIEGEAYLADAYAEEKGVIAITGHIGCWELLAAYLVSRGYPVTVVARALRIEKWQKRLQAIRSSVGVKMIDRDGGARGMLEVLQRKEILGVLIDQRTSVSGMFVPFFNRPAHTSSGVAKLACLSGAKIVPMAIYMTERCRHVIRILEPISPPARLGEREAEIEEITAACSRSIETLIRLDPKQWLWFHDRWPETERTGLKYAVQN